MKKVLLTLSAVAFAASVFAQGTVVMNNRVIHDDCVPPYLTARAEVLLINACSAFESFSSGWRDDAATGRTILEILQPREWRDRSFSV